MSGTYGKTKLLLETSQEARDAVCADLVPKSCFPRPNQTIYIDLFY